MGLGGFLGLNTSTKETAIKIVQITNANLRTSE
jgi:hypothetical protein